MKKHPHNITATRYPQTGSSVGQISMHTTPKVKVTARMTKNHQSGTSEESKYQSFFKCGIAGSYHLAVDEKRS